MGYAKRGLQPIPRVASNARLDDDGGSGGQLVLGFLIKGIVLGIVVYALANYELQTQLRNFLYGEPRPCLSACLSFLCGMSLMHTQFELVIETQACVSLQSVRCLITGSGMHRCQSTLHKGDTADGARAFGLAFAVLGMYAFLSLLMDGPASLATSIVGLRIAPHFDQPYLASSLTDFWSRRWNLTAGNALRFLVHFTLSKLYALQRAIASLGLGAFEQDA